MGMEYTAHIPGPWNGNGIYYTYPRSLEWEWNILHISQIPGMGMEYTLGPWNGNGIYWVLDHYNVSVCHTALGAVCVKILIFPSKLL